MALCRGGDPRWFVGGAAPRARRRAGLVPPRAGTADRRRGAARNQVA